MATMTTPIYTPSLHYVLTISCIPFYFHDHVLSSRLIHVVKDVFEIHHSASANLGFILDMQLLRSEEHTSELQSRPHLVCRLLLEKKKNICITLWESVAMMSWR